MKKALILAVLASSPLSFNSAAVAADTALTIYSKASPGAIQPDSYRPAAGQNHYVGAAVPGYGVVRQVREVELPSKESVVKLRDVAAYIDPTTVQFRSLTSPKDTKVVEQDYQFDLVGRSKLLQKYIDKDITVETIVGDSVESSKGTLLSTEGGLTLKLSDDSIKAINNYSSIAFPELPGGLMTKPTLVWNILTGNTGKHKAEVSYQTQGITWWADYNLTYKEGKDANTGLVDVSSWVSIINQTGATFDNAKLKLMAGDVQRAGAAQPLMYRKGMAADMAMAEAAPAFDEKAFFEYHLYTLNRPVTLPDNSTKQMELIPAAYDVPVEKELVFGGGVGNRKVDIFLKLENKKEHGLGVALPAGRMRVNQRDSDNSLEFIGENIINHTAQGEDVKIRLGSAFDVVGERKLLKNDYDGNRRISVQEIEVKLRNRKKEAVTVIAEESLNEGQNWEITNSSEKYKKEDATKIHYMVTLKPDEEKVIHYTVKYTW